MTMTRFVRTFIALILAMAGTLARAESFDHSLLDGLLERTVSSQDGGRSTVVNYAAIKGLQSTLSSYLEDAAAVDRKAFDAWPKTDQLAFLINVYNAATIELVAKAYPDIASIKDLGTLLSSPWRKNFVKLFGSERSLDDIEHRLIRGSGRYDDPRIHFAVNCASIGCPALRTEAYSGDRLDSQLEEQTILFLSDRSRNRLNGDRLDVSPIFKWYREDFEKGFRGADSLSAFLATYAGPLGLDGDVEKRLAEDRLKIGFLKYDWRLNAKR